MSTYEEQITHAYSRISRILDDCLPIRDYPQPLSIWTQSQWDDVMGILTIKQMWILMMMTENKLLEYRTYPLKKKWIGQPILVKASKKPPSKKEVCEWLTTPSINNLLSRAPLFSDHLDDPDWFWGLCKHYSDRFLFVAIFDNEPVNKKSYLWAGIGVNALRKYPWYMKKMTLLKGHEGVKFTGKGQGQLQITSVVNNDLKWFLIQNAKVTFLPLAVFCKKQPLKL